MSKSSVGKVSIVCCLAVLFFSSFTVVKAQELKAADIIAKHLDSIGTKQKRDEMKNRLAAGRSEFTSKIPYAKLAGKAIIVSETDNLYFVSSFNSANYPFEKIGVFKGKTSLPFATAGNRSPLGGFLYDTDKILNSGVFTGSISNTWSFLDSEMRKAKIDSSGKKKIEGREMYVLSYVPKGTSSSDFSIKLYFDAQTFQHIRTEYQQNLPARNYKGGLLGGNAEGGAKSLLVETFGDYKDAGGLTLPYSYKIRLLLDSQSSTNEYEWSFALTQYAFNQNLDAKFFSFDEK